MKIVDKYYNELWNNHNTHHSNLKSPKEGILLKILHTVFNPAVNDRHTVAKKLLSGLSGKLLDIGCWGGKSLQLIGAFEQFEELYGVDIIQESVDDARQIGIKATQCNLNEESLPFDDNYFDVVTCLAVIGQIFDPYFVINEIHRVLKTNGILILNVPNVASLPNRIRLLLGRLPITSHGPGWDGGQLHYFTKYNTINFLNKSGFEVDEVKTTGSGTILRQISPSLLSGTLTFKARRK